MRVLIVVAAWLIGSAPGYAQNNTQLSGTDFVSDFRDMAGKTVTVTDCHVAGTTSDFIRCETPNGAASYALEAKTMNREDLKSAYNNCPTGSRNKPACRYSVTGTVKQSGMPSLENAKLGPYKSK